MACERKVIVPICEAPVMDCEAPMSDSELEFEEIADEFDLSGMEKTMEMMMDETEECSSRAWRKLHRKSLAVRRCSFIAFKPAVAVLTSGGDAQGKMSHIEAWWKWPPLAYDIFKGIFSFLQKKIVVICLNWWCSNSFLKVFLKTVHLWDIQSFVFIFYGLDCVSRLHHNDKKSRINPVGVWWSPFLFKYNTVWLWHLMWQSTALGVASVSWHWGHWWDGIMEERGTFFLQFSFCLVIMICIDL